MIKFFIILLQLHLTALVAVAQQDLHDTAFAPSAASNAKSVFFKAMKGQLALFNGSEYQPYRPLGDEHPYFISEDWAMGSIQYNGENYETVFLLYNTFTDDVIIEDANENVIQLIAARVASFTLDEYKFVRLNDSTIPAGFYNLLSNGRVKLYAKRKKEFNESVSGLKITRNFIEKNRYYILKSAVFYPVRNKRSVISLFDDRKREINQFIRKNHIRFGANRENAIVMLTEFYNGNIISK